jgi:hypothetical protein
VDGQSLMTPSIRIMRNRVNPYNVSLLAPREREYLFSYVGTHHEGTRLDYVFDTAQRTANPAYRVITVAIDGVHLLPRTITYATGNGEVTGHGTLLFWPQDRYWVIEQAIASAKIDGKVARERLVFHNYDFPPMLPDSTFIAPRSQATVLP